MNQDTSRIFTSNIKKASPRNTIAERGSTAFLHVETNNTSSILKDASTTTICNIWPWSPVERECRNSESGKYSRTLMKESILSLKLGRESSLEHCLERMTKLESEDWDASFTKKADIYSHLFIQQKLGNIKKKIINDLM